MIIIGIVCLLLGLILGVPILWTLGIILVVIGLILLLVGSAGRELGGRRYWYRTARTCPAPGAPGTFASGVGPVSRAPL